MKTYVKQALIATVAIGLTSAVAKRSVEFRNATNSESGGGFLDRILGYIGF